MAPKNDGNLTDNNGKVNDGQFGKLDGDSEVLELADVPLQVWQKAM